MSNTELQKECKGVKCPKCGSEENLLPGLHKHVVICASKLCWYAWSTEQQSIIDEQKAEIERLKLQVDNILKDQVELLTTYRALKDRRQKYPKE